MSEDLSAGHDIMSMPKGNFAVIFVVEFLFCVSWKLNAIDLYVCSEKLLMFSSRRIRLNKDMLRNMKCVHSK
jgi:hypothetical protein